MKKPFALFLAGKDLSGQFRDIKMGDKLRPSSDCVFMADKSHQWNWAQLHLWLGLLLLPSSQVSAL